MQVKSSTSTSSLLDLDNVAVEKPKGEVSGHAVKSMDKHSKSTKKSNWTVALAVALLVGGLILLGVMGLGIGLGWSLYVSIGLGVGAAALVTSALVVGIWNRCKGTEKGKKQQAESTVKDQELNKAEKSEEATS